MDTFIWAFDVEYIEEDDYLPRHIKGFHIGSTIQDVIDFLDNIIGVKGIETINIECLDGKSEFIFTESEYRAFDYIKDAIQNDKSYEDYKMVLAEREVRDHERREKDPADFS
jgi:hypothetical protein